MSNKGQLLGSGARIDPRRITALREATNVNGAPCLEIELDGKTIELIRFASHSDRTHAFNTLKQSTTGGHMLSNITSDVKGFISENRQLFYWVALLVLLDHFVFEGAFRHRLQSLMERMISRVEQSVKPTKEAS